VRPTVRRAIHTGILVLLAALSVAARTPQPITIEEFLGRKSLGETAFSPDGAWIVAAIGEKKSWDAPRVNHLWLVPNCGGGARQLTAAAASDWNPLWSPDGRLIAFLSERVGAPQVFVIAIAGGEARQVTGAKEGVTAFCWAGDAHLAYVALEPRAAALVAAEEAAGGGWVAGTKARTSALWLISADGEGDPVRVTDGKLFVAGVSASRAGERFALLTTPDSDPYSVVSASRVVVVDRQGRELVALAEGRTPANPLMSPDGRHLAAVASTVGLSARDGLFVVDVETGETRNVTAGLEPTILDAAWLDDRALSFLTLRGTACAIYRVSVEGEEPTPLLAPHWVTYGYTVHPAGRLLAFVGGRGHTPQSLYVHSFGADPAAARPLLTPNPWLAERALARTQVLRYASFDGQPIEAILTLPAAAPGLAPPFPLVVMPHGGPDGTSLDEFDVFAQLFAQAGFATLAPNFRGGIGYGNAFYAANRGRIGDVDYRDIMAGVDHAVRAGIADPRRLLVGGSSFGGTMTNWIIGHDSRFRAAVVVSGVSDYVSRYATSDVNRGEAARWEFGRLPAEDLDFFVRSSPLAHLARATTPTLILHGEEDSRVPVGQAWETYRMLRDAGVEAELVIYPDAGHAISRPKQFADLTRRWVGWYTRWLAAPEGSPGATPKIVN
jgi:dipeptidyl aminopeptidase/acylaminoacyl peptidase